MPIEKFGHRIKDAVDAGLGSRTKIYELLAAGKLKAVKNGQATIIVNLTEYIENLRPAEIKMPAVMAKRQRVPLDDMDETISQ